MKRRYKAVRKTTRRYTRHKKPVGFFDSLKMQIGMLLTSLKEA
jgi:hypothetical protein